MANSPPVPLTPSTRMIAFGQPMALGLQWLEAGLRQLEAVIEVQHRMARRTALLCQHAASELATAPSTSSALSIQANLLVAAWSDAAKLVGELSLAAVPRLPGPVMEALAENSPPGGTPEQVTPWAAVQVLTPRSPDAAQAASRVPEPVASDRPQAASDRRRTRKAQKPRAAASPRRGR
ncbi:MAG TPA: hypothetical protein VEA35_14400 [Ramlibacter sp.]|nr:hypothetical protein [Ramlibacter sp.]